MKFIKAKEQIEVTPIAEKPKMEEKRNVDEKRMVNNSHKQSVGRSESRAKFHPRSQKSLDQPMCVTTTDFKGTLDQIVKSWEQWIMQVLQGLEDLGALAHEVEVMIPEW